MKLPFSYKKHSFGTLLGVSMIGHVLFFGTGVFWSPAPEFAVQEASQSMEIVMLRPAPQIQKVEPVVEQAILATKDLSPVVEPVKKIEKPKEKPVIEKKVVEKVEEEKPSAAPVEQGVRREAKPDYLNNPPPTYPSIARQRGWEGTVYLKVFVERDGAPSKVEIEKSSGHRVLDRAALRAVKRWKFLPARAGRMALASWVEIPVEFVLENQTGKRS